ncbi:MAG TPA: NAD(P)H-binding protein [Salinimicrobium sp.]|nr:NAD(P)H-binding protein [Salinimicrobium sp.]
MKTAILLGATGLTGGILLKKLLEDKNYSKIKVFSRRKLEMENPKLEQHILDLFQLEKLKNEFFGDEIFCCIGSTKKKTPENDIYRKVDYGIPVAAAKMAKENGISTFLVISSLGSDPESRFFYNKTKGEMERDVLQQKIPNTYIFRPSLIGGERQEKRIFEYLWKKVMLVGDKLLVGPLKKYESIHPEIIAEAMMIVANSGCEKAIIASDEIKKIVKNRK